MWTLRAGGLQDTLYGVVLSSRGIPAQWPPMGAQIELKLQCPNLINGSSLKQETESGSTKCRARSEPLPITTAARG